MAFVQSAISFGAYQFPAAFWLRSVQDDATIDEVKIPFLDGTSAPPGTRGSKKINVSGTIGGFGAVDSSGNLILTRDQAENEAQLMRSYLASGYQKLVVGYTPARYIYAQLQKFTTAPVQYAGRLALGVELTFLAQDPRWLASAAGSVSLPVGVTENVTSNGTTQTYPIVTINGPLTNPFVKVTPAGASGYIEDALAVTLASTDQIVVDCDPRNRANAVMLNGVPRLDLLGTAGVTNTLGDSAPFPYLRVGVNTALVSAASGTGASTIAWNDAWL